MRIQSISSGSRGNITHLQTEQTAILIDIGLSCKRTTERLLDVGLSPDDIEAIFVTHEHSDHISGISVFSRKYKIPVFVARETWRRLYYKQLNWHEVIVFDPGKLIEFKDLKIHPFRIQHDTSDPVAYAFKCGDKKFGMATDLGTVTNLVLHSLKDCDAVLLESNHDEEMLMKGPYPWSLKKRVSSHLGHLSNAQSAELLEKIISPSLKNVILAHLSEQNNTPELAAQRAKNIIKNSDLDIEVLVASQYEPIQEIEI